MTPSIDRIRAALTAALNSAQDGELVQRDMRDDLLELDLGLDHSAEMWGMKVGEQIVGQAVIKGSEGRIVIDVEPEVPAFFELTNSKTVEIPSETERMLVECDFDRALSMAFGDDGSSIRAVCNKLGIEILPKFRNYGDNSTLVYERNELKAA